MLKFAVLFTSIFASNFAPSSLFAQEKPKISSQSVQWLNFSSEAFVVPHENGLNTYYLKSNAPIRDNFLAFNEIQIDEHSNLPFTRTGSTLFDSLFALAIQEMKKSSVSTISDFSFDTAHCECFETGEKWRYVWTRDTAFAADLGLAALDPIRTMNSLSFKLSGFRKGLGQGEQIVQDTGSGGSWPISTDRVVWALGAEQTLKHLPYGSDLYQSFLDRSYEALKNTILTDRVAIFDKTDGLYTGEQSFLDWREQSYPEWTSNKVVHIGMSKSLSTNVAHYLALKNAVHLANLKGKSSEAQEFDHWATDLKASINKHFWDGNSFRSIKTTFLDQRAPKYYDLLGISLAVLSGVATPEQGRSSLASYPQTLVGAPVIWPQHQDIAIYHNRAIWPFVSAYALKASRQVRDPALVTSFIQSLIIGPSQNLSNMENYEFSTLSNWLVDGKFSGPVVNSRRQLWSVAGYLGMVMDVIFGKEVRTNAIRFNPALTYAIREQLFNRQSTLALKNYRFQNKKLNITLRLPSYKDTPKGVDSFFEVSQIRINDKVIDTDEWLSISSLKSDDDNNIEIILKDARKLHNSTITIMDTERAGKDEYFAPRTPVLAPIGLSDNYPLLSFHSSENDQIVYQVFKDGKLIGSTEKSFFLDLNQSLEETACYSVSAVYRNSNLESFPSEPFCFWPPSSVQRYPVNGLHVRSFGGHSVASADGRIFFKDWGLPNQRLQLQHVSPIRSGKFAIQLVYQNLDRINTGITCGVKLVKVFNDQTGKVIDQGVAMLPHHDHGWIDSNFVTAKLDEHHTYTIQVEDFMNMSYLDHFNTYRFNGGKNGPYNQFSVSEIKLLYLSK